MSHEPVTTPEMSLPAGEDARRGGDSNSALPCAPEGSGATAERARTWTIALPPGLQLLTSNQRGHWAKTYRIGQDIVDAAILLTRAAKMPQLDRVRIVAEFQPPYGRRRIVRDTHNLAPSVKCAIDGIVRAGGLTDDSDRYVAEVTYVPGEQCPLGRLLIHITELPAQENP